MEETLKMGNDTNEVIAAHGAFKDFEDVWYEKTYQFASDLIIECALVRGEMDRADRLLPIDVYKT